MLDLNDTLLFLLALWVLVVVAYALVRWASAYLVQRRSNANQGRIIAEALDAAIDQRSVFRIEILSKELHDYKIEGICTEADAKYIHIETAGSFASKELIGEQVLVFFHNSYRRKASFFQFSSRIVDVEQQGSTHIVRLTRPTSLQPGQKRAFFRITPANDTIVGLGLWSLQDQPLPSSVTQLPPALLRFLPDRSENIMLTDISAGGMRLLLSDQASLPAHVGKGSPLLCLLRLKGPENGPPHTFWFVCSVVMHLAGGEGDNYLSLRFTTWATTEPEQKQLVWFPVVRDEGIALLSAWIMRHHLEQTKKL